MKVLMINLPYAGHVIPTIGLVQKLVQKGCTVAYLLPHEWKEFAEESGAAFICCDNHKQLSEQIKNAYRMADEIADQFDLILYEQFFFLGKHLAQKHCKPAVRIFTAPCPNDRIMSEYLKSGPLSIFRYKWISRAFTKDIASHIPLKTDNWLDEIIHNPCDLNLVYTLKEFQPDAESFPEEQYKFIGPSIYERKQKEFKFKKTDRPLIYISLGTIVKGSASFFQMCIDAFSKEDVDVIISAGQKFNLKKLKHIPSNIQIYPYVNQIEILKCADVFVTHGGMNSISEALVAGVPMLVIPFSSDQPINAHSVVENGTGIQTNYASVNQLSFKNAVFSLIGNPAVHANLKRIQDKIKTAPGNEGAAEMIIRHYRTQKPL